MIRALLYPNTNKTFICPRTCKRYLSTDITSNKSVRNTKELRLLSIMYMYVTRVTLILYLYHLGLWHTQNHSPTGDIFDCRVSLDERSHDTTSSLDTEDNT